MKAQHKCTYCEAEVLRWPSQLLRGPIYCSKQCKAKARGPLIACNCAVCSIAFDRRPSVLKKANYCSKECSAIGRSKIVAFTCPICSKAFDKNKKNVKSGITYCSSACRYKARKVPCAKSGYPPPDAQWHILHASKQATLYFARIFDEKESFYKVGITTEVLSRRFRHLKREANYDYEILASHISLGKRVYDWEQSILETFSHLKYTPTRKLGGYSECFTLEALEPILSIFPL